MGSLGRALVDCATDSAQKHFERRVTTGSERTRLKVNISALTAGDTENLLTLGTNNNCRFRSPTTAKNLGWCSADNMLAKRNEKLDLFRWCEIGNWHRIYKTRIVHAEPMKPVSRLMMRLPVYCACDNNRGARIREVGTADA